MEKIGLVEAIDALRAELTQAASASVQQDLRFKVDQVTVELEVVAERTSQGRTGLKFWVVEAEGQHERKRGRTHRVSVSLTPQTSQGDPFLTGEDQIPG